LARTAVLRQAQDEGGARGEVITNPVVSLSNHGTAWWSFQQGEATARQLCGSVENWENTGPRYEPLANVTADPRRIRLAQAHERTHPPPVRRDPG
jgi:hypothetical protein